MSIKARVIAFYLPQFHPIPENDEWWGKGFTEWTNVGKAKPLFRGHDQPRVPGDLGYYDLRNPEVREEQAKLAKDAGIEGFAYWHYWFGNGKRLLERPFNEVLKSGKPDYPFCLAWANHSWSNSTWNKDISKKTGSCTLMEQLYLGVADYTAHFYAVLDAFKDKRYIKVDEKPIFIILNPLDLGIPEFIAVWRNLAKINGLKGIHFIGLTHNATLRNQNGNAKSKILLKFKNDAAERYKKTLDIGFDSVCSNGMVRAEILSKGLFNKYLKFFLSNLLNYQKLDIYDQKKINKFYYTEEDKWENVYPTLIPRWDRSPRAGKKACIYVNSSPKVFKNNIENVISMIKDKEDEHKLVFLASWNEWAEGNYIEPDLKYGKEFLNVLKDILK
ncbi:glycosyltransferase WbsX family protein [Petrimonas sp.]|uniref:glycosyltransferase WbsX family protein n=1 Tax=Petrimonas sp. TaxID=2023866 RepID=UPI002FCA8BF6